MPVTGDIVAALQAENAALRERLRLLEIAAKEASTMWKGWWFDIYDGDIPGESLVLSMADLAACLDAGDQPLPPPPPKETPR